MSPVEGPPELSTAIPSKLSSPDSPIPSLWCVRQLPLELNESIALLARSRTYTTSEPPDASLTATPVGSENSQGCCAVIDRPKTWCTSSLAIAGALASRAAPSSASAALPPTSTRRTWLPGNARSRAREWQASTPRVSRASQPCRSQPPIVLPISLSSPCPLERVYRLVIRCQAATSGYPGGHRSYFRPDKSAAPARPGVMHGAGALS